MVVFGNYFKKFFYRNDDNGTVHCQLHCPVQCDWLNEQSCPGGLDINGCPEPDYCMSLGYETDFGNGPVFCPTYCSTNCGKDEMWCSTGKKEDGCWGPSYCTPKTTMGKITDHLHDFFCP